MRKTQKSTTKLDRQAAYAQKAADRAAAQAFHKAWWVYERLHAVTDSDKQELRNMGILWSETE